MTKKMKEALADLPIEHQVNEGALKRHKEAMYWMGRSGKIYHYNTLKALVKQGFLQYITTGTARLIRMEDKYKTVGYKRWNDSF